MTTGTPLARKLGIRRGHVVLLVNSPLGFHAQLEGLPEDVDVRWRPGPRADVVVSFHTELATVPAALEAVRKSGSSLWIAWPKRTSGVPTDITDDLLRRFFLPIGWVDNKVCAIDEVWTALRFVVRKDLRI